MVGVETGRALLPLHRGGIYGLHAVPRRLQAWLWRHRSSCSDTVPVGVQDLDSRAEQIELGPAATVQPTSHSQTDSDFAPPVRQPGKCDDATEMVPRGGPRKRMGAIGKEGDTSVEVKEAKAGMARREEARVKRKAARAEAAVVADGAVAAFAATEVARAAPAELEGKVQQWCEAVVQWCEAASRAAAARRRLRRAGFNARRAAFQAAGPAERKAMRMAEQAQWAAAAREAAETKAAMANVRVKLTPRRMRSYKHKVRGGGCVVSKQPGAAPAQGGSPPTAQAQLVADLTTPDFEMSTPMLVMPFTVFKEQKRIFKSTKLWRDEAVEKGWLIRYAWVEGGSGEIKDGVFNGSIVVAEGKVAIFISHVRHAAALEPLAS